MYKIFLGLGCNVGDRRQNLRQAIALLGEFVQDIRISSIYESQALLPDGAPAEWNKPFYNMVLSGYCLLSSERLLLEVKTIEDKIGRKKTGHWSPREIDIDILAVGDVILETTGLSIPHKEMLKRDFVLIPLAEIAPNWLHPVVKQTAGELVKYFVNCDLKKVTSPLLFGIINITPDSFSDGGVNFTPLQALDNIQKMIDEGADIIDIGAESTRPNAISVSPEEEWIRLEPVLKELIGTKIPISIDTRNAQTAKKAIACGAKFINDVTGFSAPEMVTAVRDSQVKLIVMHSLSVPADRSIVLPTDKDPVEVIIAWAEKRLADLLSAGIAKDRLIFDPGIGFGKNAEQSKLIIEHVEKFRVLGVPIFIGHSRKSFLGENADDNGTIKISRYLAEKKIDYLRVHNVYRHRLELL